MKRLTRFSQQFLLILLSLAFSSAIAQKKNVTIKVTPSNINMNVGDKVKLIAVVIDDNGKELTNRRIRMFSRKAKAVSVDSTNTLIAYLPGTYSIIIISPDPSGDRSLRARLDLEINVKYPPLATIEIQEVPNEIYEGITLPLKIKVFDNAGLERKGLELDFKSNNPEIASLDRFNNLSTYKSGKTTITASVEDIQTIININVVENPVSKLTLEAEGDEARTGDVFHFIAKAWDEQGTEIKDAPILYTFQGKAYDVSSSASGMIKQDGRFVADEPGLYTISVSSGQFTAHKTVKINPRGVQRKVEFVGKGSVNEKHTSDFWVWEGIDGRDYAVTGTWGADGTVYFWDVTNPGEITKIDSIQVDARTVNDVKVSEDGRICIISREGASNRKNGLVILDVANPRDVKIISTFTENLTGGVHNIFISKNHVYALSAGRKYYIINIEDPKSPRIVNNFELGTPGHSIHDVWVEDGIAYSSNWSDGVQLVDVGNGIAGGSPENPKHIASYAYPSGANHAAFPYRSKATGKFYVIAGDEMFPYGLNLNQENIAGGFLHIIDFTDLENPEEIARFEVPGAGSHNLWIEDDILYVAFYNGGVRVVDLSGELMGDLFKQGREIGWIIPSDPEGYIPNAPFTWGAQPYKGHIFYSDWNSGLWAAKLEPEKPKDTTIESK